MNPILKKSLKILAWVFGGLLTLLLILAAFVQFAPAPSYESVAIPTLQVKSDDDFLTHGKALVQMNCYACHANPESGTLEGQFFGKTPLGEAYTANITQDPTHGIGQYTSGELYRLLRTGIKKDHSLIVPFMPKFQNMSENDLQAIIAFLQSNDPMLEASRAERPVELNLLGKALLKFAWKPLDYPSSYAETPQLADTQAYGRYLVTSQLLCYGCHSATHEVDLVQPEQTQGYLAGGMEFEPGLVSPSLRVAEGGLPGYTMQDFVAAMRQGKKPSGESFRPPMHGYPQLDSLEIVAIWTYLSKVKPPSPN